MDNGGSSGGVHADGAPVQPPLARVEVDDERVQRGVEGVEAVDEAGGEARGGGALQLVQADGRQHLVVLDGVEGEGEELHVGTEGASRALHLHHVRNVLELSRGHACTRYTLRVTHYTVVARSVHGEQPVCASSPHSIGPGADAWTCLHELHTTQPLHSNYTLHNHYTLHTAQ